MTQPAPDAPNPPKVYVLKSAPLSAAPTLGRYWQLWRAVEQRQPGLDRFRLTRRVLGCVPKVPEMAPEQLAKMIHVFERLLSRSQKLGAGSQNSPSRPSRPSREPAKPFPPSASMLPNPVQVRTNGTVPVGCPALEENSGTGDASLSPHETTPAADNSGPRPVPGRSTPALTPSPTPAAQARGDDPRLVAADSAQSARWRQLHTEDAKLTAKFPSMTYAERARLLGCSVKLLWDIHHVYAPRGFSSARGNCGDKPDYTPTPAELACVREIAVRLDESVARGRGRGTSRIAAYRLAAKSGDPRLSEQFRAVVNRDRQGKRVPPSWMRLLDLPTNVLDAHRDVRSTQATYVCTPRNRTFVTADGQELPMRCGSIFETDDGTLNFYAHIPWPFGGDKCSERFGVKLARWQFLPVVDVCSEMCLAFDIVCREKGSYRGEDSRAIIGRTMFEVDTPALWRLERGAWESRMVRDALALSSVPVFNAWHSKQKSGIERFFDRMWTPASLIPGHVGRDRDRFKQITNLALACQKGAHDPRDYFLSLAEATPRVIKGVEFCNTEPIVSRSGWGQWVPQERWVSQRAGSAQRLHESMRVWFAREQKVWTVRKGCLGGEVDGPQVKFPVYFQCAALWEFEGCKARVFFDPYTEPNLGTIVLEDEAWRSYRRGHVIARDVPALDLPPQAILAEEWSDPERARQLAVRKAIGQAVRVEMWNWLGGRGTRVHDGLGNTAVRQMPASATAEEVRSPKSEVRSAEMHSGTSAFGSRITPPTAESRSARRARNRADAELLNAL